MPRRNRVLKWWRHKNRTSEIMGIVRIFLKEQCPRGILSKNEHFGTNCLCHVSRLYSENSIQTLLIFLGSTPKYLEGFVWSFLSITGLRSQRQFAPKCLGLVLLQQKETWGWGGFRKRKLWLPIYGKFLASLPRRLITLQLPKQIMSTFWFSQALLFLPKRSAKTACARADEDCPTFIQSGLCSRRSVVSVYWGLLLLKGLLRWPEIIFAATRHDLSMPQVSDFYHHGYGG